MNQSDEDALVLQVIENRLDRSDLHNAIRLAIRAAYAKGAEDAKERAIKAVRAEQYPDTIHPAEVASDAIRRG